MLDHAFAILLASHLPCLVNCQSDSLNCNYEQLSGKNHPHQPRLSNSESVVLEILDIDFHLVKRIQTCQ